MRFKYFAFLFVFSQSLCFALPPEFDMDRYMLAAEKHFQENRLDELAVYLEKIQALPAKPPALYHYYKASIYREAGDMQKARESLEKYVEMAGRGGEYYQQALQSMTEIDELGKKTAPQYQKQDPSVAAVSKELHEQHEAYANRLKSLYLTDSYSNALVVHINTLLASAVYTGSKMQAAGMLDEGIQYSVSVTSNKEILTVKKDRMTDPEKITSQKLNVYGKNPFIDFECDYAQAACWIKMPDGYGQWMNLAYNERVARELSEALRRLIRTLQQENN